MFIIDALIGNTDRHNGNWGVLVNESSGELKLAPVYDCGSSFCPLIEEKEIQKKSIAHIYLSVSSVITHNGKRINYSEYLPSCNEVKVNAAIKRMMPQINIKKIHELIESVDFVSNQRKHFYHPFL